MCNKIKKSVSGIRRGFNRNNRAFFETFEQLKLFKIF